MSLCVCVLHACMLIYGYNIYTCPNCESVFGGHPTLWVYTHHTVLFLVHPRDKGWASLIYGRPKNTRRTCNFALLLLLFFYHAAAAVSGRTGIWEFLERRVTFLVEKFTDMVKSESHMSFVYCVTDPVFVMCQSTCTSYIYV